ncbi:RNA ligase family protein [Halocatena halophila]|uniref:RNA ligase family protein n=1 Tax=Halocatena halophila TaxID=2814576 RepID=UPI002ED6090B
MKRYPKLPTYESGAQDDLLSSGTIVVTEKLDGSNFRFTFDEDEGFTFGSRNTAGEQLHHKQFSEPISYIKSNCETDALSSLQEDLGQLVLFGEAMIPHTIAYDWDHTPAFVGFDVWNVETQKFYHTEQAKEIVETVGLPFTPVVDAVSVDTSEEWAPSIPESAFYNGVAEGVVLKNHQTESYYKLVREEFTETLKRSPTRSDFTDTERIVEQYVTPARIESVAHQLVGDGAWEKIELPMMEILPQAVIRDMMTEEGGSIVIEEDVELDTRELRSLVSDKCVYVIKMIKNRREN